jgi:predicted O-methyltransferase YrrM
VHDHAPAVVVETGSGASTLVIAYSLKALGKGRLISLEVNEAYASRTREEVARHGLTDWVTVVHAPLRDVVVDGQTYRWHDPHALDGVPAIDLVFDDGPPLYLGPALRRAALPLLASRLAPDAVYCMNFVAAEERRTVASWLARDPGLHAEWYRTRKGNVVLTRTPAPMRS